MAEYIKRQDDLNTGRIKINEELTKSNNNAEKAKIDSSEALNIANQSIYQSQSTQDQLNQVIIDGDSSVEAAAARVDEDNITHTTLKERIDDGFTKTKTQLAETDEQRFYESMVNRKKPGMYASYVDDDGNTGVFTKLLPLAREYGIPFTSALITSRLDAPNMMTEAQRKEAHESGLIEFISHTHNHDVNNRPNDMSEEELYADFLTSKSIMRSKGYNYHGIVLPFGDRNDKVRRVVKDCFDYVIGTGSGGPTGSGKVSYPGELDNQYLYRISLQWGFDYVEEKVDELVSRGVGWIIFVGHVDQDGWYTESYMRQVIEYVMSKGIEFVKTQDGINKIGNIAQFGDTTISADNKITSDRLGKKQYKRREEGVTFDTPITDFPINTETFTDINSPNATEFPRGLPGILTTHYYHSGPYSYQEYKLSRRDLMYRRFWDDTNSKWTDFNLVDTTQSLPADTLTNETNPTVTMLANKISYCKIMSGRTAGFPESKSGLLMVNSIDYTSNYPYREYHIFGENKVYRSAWDGSSWSAWELIIGAFHQIPGNTISAQKLASTYPIGVSLTYITGGGDRTGLPSQQSGILTTYHQTTATKGLAYQEYKTYNSFDKFIRHEMSDGSWSGWKRYMLE